MAITSTTVIPWKMNQLMVSALMIFISYSSLHFPSFINGTNPEIVLLNLGL